jgi:hypothetical protein
MNVVLFSSKNVVRCTDYKSLSFARHTLYAYRMENEVAAPFLWVKVQVEEADRAFGHNGR